MTCWRCLVSGVVQGVWYRGNTRRQAQLLGIAGYARNLPDGRVEVLACGEEPQLAALRDWLWRGPAAAVVEAVECREIALSAVPSGFSIG